MVNANELKAEFVRNGYTQKDVAIKLGISSRSLSNKLKKGIFKSKEIEQLIDILNIKKPMPIFFADSVTLKDTERRANNE